MGRMAGFERLLTGHHGGRRLSVLRGTVQYVCALALFAGTPVMLQAQGAVAELQSPIKSVTAITEVFADGPRVTAAAVEYDKDIATRTLTPRTFTVQDRTITKVYANTSPTRAVQGHDGRFVILELSPDDAAAYLNPRARTQGRGPGLGGAMPGGPGPGGPPRRMMAAAFLPAKVFVEQVNSVATTSGHSYPAVAQPTPSSRTINLVVDDFVQRVFKDPKSGETLRYNLFVPKNYDAAKPYPLVLFMPDASLTGAPTEQTLTQGIGAVIWATPEEQAKHPALVLAPTYDKPEATDDFQTSDVLDTTVDLVNAIASQYSVDRNRLYTTGQSGGCMLSVAMMVKHPDLFAAAMLVAGQWDPKAMTTLVNRSMWITVAEGDTKAFPGMNASLAAMEQAGAKVARAKWSARLGAEETRANDQNMLRQGTRILYTVYDKGTTFPPGQETDGTEHMQTWKVAYYNEGIRDWLFQQKR